MRFALVVVALIGGTVTAVAWTAHNQWAFSRQAASSQQVSAKQHPTVTKEEWEGWMKTRTNWGRWGSDDQLGAMNLVTETKRRQAMGLNKGLAAVSLAHKPVLIPKERPDGISYLEIKLNHLKGSDFTIEDQMVAFHGSSFTHMDALCHGDYAGKTYNGYAVSEVITEGGCKKLGIDNLPAGVVTRGVVIDIPFLKGVKTLEPGTHVYPDDIEAFERRAGLRIGPGDAIFLHTGRWTSGKPSGYDITVGPWMKDRGVSIVSSDAIQDVSEIPGLTLPLHHYILAGLGANIIDNADLERVTETARRLNRWEFMLVVLPVAVPGGTGYPVNPIAIF
jgi:kynurenine formamidase